MAVHMMILLLQITLASAVARIGVNWGLQASHPIPAKTIVQLLKNNGFNKVKLFDADSKALAALRNSGIEVMVGIPNSMLYNIANKIQVAENWVSQNLSTYVSNGVNIRYIAVGNEPFLTTFNGAYTHTILPALQNIQAAVVKAGLGEKVGVTVPLNADVYESRTGVPSGGDFREDIGDVMLKIVDFYNETGAPFIVNIHSFISLYNDRNFPYNFAFFNGYSPPLVDGVASYQNVFDANFDTLVSSLEKHGYGNVPIIIGEIGWPTDGDINANRSNAERFNKGFINHSFQGTPRRPGPLNAYLFSLMDEDLKSIQPGNFERHWGLFSFDGNPKYDLDSKLVPAIGVRYFKRQWCIMSPAASLLDQNLSDSVGYACSHADCTSLGEWNSCRNLNDRENVSYAFNNYYQMYNQDESACRFSNLAMVSLVDPSVGDCKFAIMIESSAQRSRVIVFFVFLLCIYSLIYTI